MAGALEASDSLKSRSRALAMKALAFIDRLAKLDGWLGALCLFLLCSLMIAGILVRSLSAFVYWLPKDLPMAWEYSSYLMAVTFTFGAALTLRAGGHIRVKILLATVSPAFARILEMVSTTIGLGFASFFAYAMGHFAMRAYLTDERSLASDTPIWFPQAAWPSARLLLALQLLARLGQLLLGEPPEDKAIIR